MVQGIGKEYEGSSAATSRTCVLALAAGDGSQGIAVHWYPGARIFLTTTEIQYSRPHLVTRTEVLLLFIYVLHGQCSFSLCVLYLL
jgi:hypothetical protein